MFMGAAAFNQPLASWQTGKVTAMSNMFMGAAAFNQSLALWQAGSVTAMCRMFHSVC